MTARRLRITSGALTAATLMSVATATAAVANPSSTAADNSNNPKVAISEVAHRGSSFEAPENTIAAVVEGIADKSDLVEIDVQRSADGELVVIHDTTLNRTTNVEEVFPDRTSYAVGEFTLAELKQLDAGSWKGEEFVGEQIPTLQEVLDVLRPSASGLLLEMKAPELYPGIAEELVAELQAQPGYLNSTKANGKLVVQSFNWDFMADFNALLPDVTTGLLGVPSDAQMVEFSAWADQINPHYSAASVDFVNRVHELGMDIFVYTVDGEDTMVQMVENGVDGIITNKPNLLDQVLRSL
jgi:glycerophosphoryl diester phosphodiesterase